MSLYRASFEVPKISIFIFLKIFIKFLGGGAQNRPLNDRYGDAQIWLIFAHRLRVTGSDRCLSTPTGPESDVGLTRLPALIAGSVCVCGGGQETIFCGSLGFRSQVRTHPVQMLRLFLHGVVAHNECEQNRRGLSILCMRSQASSEKVRFFLISGVLCCRSRHTAIAQGALFDSLSVRRSIPMCTE